MSATVSAEQTGADAPLVAIILINYKGREDTLECLASLSALTYPAYRVYVVDQPFGVDEKQRDGTPEAIRAQYPAVRVIENTVNNGFAGGNNIGMRQALADQADYVFLLNNDTTVAPDLLETLIALAESDPKIGIVGPWMLYYDHPETLWATGGSMGEQGQAVLMNEGRAVADVSPTVSECDYIIGCGLLAKRALLETIGLFDERYFLYYEESDLCARARRAGWRIVNQPQSRLWHKVSRTTGTESELTLYYMRRNCLLYLRKNAARPAQSVLRALLDSVRLALVWQVRGKRRRCQVLLRAISDFLCQRFGRTGFKFI